jgi:hypothetical protein
MEQKPPLYISAGPRTGGAIRLAALVIGMLFAGFAIYLLLAESSAGFLAAVIAAGFLAGLFAGGRMHWLLAPLMLVLGSLIAVVLYGVVYGYLDLTVWGGFVELALILLVVEAAPALLGFALGAAVRKLARRVKSSS